MGRRGGPPPWAFGPGGPPEGFGPGGPGGFRGGPRGRMRRGDIRTALLAVLAEGPGHGYELIQRLEEKSGGAWRPSPGSVYPTLQLLEDEGHVTSAEQDGKRTFTITEAGQAEATARVTEAGGTPWEHAGRGREGHGELRSAVGGLVGAVKAVSTTGTKEQVAQATAIVAEARKALYKLLAQ